jgi:hypothetical protein
MGAWVGFRGISHTVIFRGAGDWNRLKAELHTPDTKT